MITSRKKQNHEPVWVRVKDSPWVKAGAGAAVLAAIVALVAIILGGNDREQHVNNGSCNVQGDSNNVNCPEGIPGQSLDEKLREDAERYADVEPTGDGPWPFAVVGTLDQGLKVRSTNVAEGEQLGGLAPHYPAWAVCQARSNFDPDPTTGTGPVWLKIKWDQQEPSDEFHPSNSGAKTTAWAYRGFLVPVGHNGDIPDC